MRSQKNFSQSGEPIPAYPQAQSYMRHPEAMTQPAQPAMPSDSTNTHRTTKRPAQANLTQPEPRQPYTGGDGLESLEPSSSTPNGL
jgi:hypothetical protein